MLRLTHSPTEVLRAGWGYAARAARATIGVPDYDAYRAHMSAWHPDLKPMEREAFFRERMQARYGRGATRCC